MACFSRVAWFATSLAACASALAVGVVGAHGGLGRELVDQCVRRGWECTAIVRRDDPVQLPSRKGWLQDEDDPAPRPLDDHLRCVMPRECVHCPDNLDALVFATSGVPFARDDSTDAVRAILESKPERCNRVCFVSAHGVGDSILGADAGIQAMRAWYLKATYQAKEAQEALVSALPCRTLIVRPRVLSYTRVPLNPIATPRHVLAAQILDWVEGDPHAAPRAPPPPSADAQPRRTAM